MEGKLFRTSGILLVLATFILPSRGSRGIVDVSPPKVSFNCGSKLPSAVVGPDHVNWPWTVLIGIPLEDEMQWFCNGVLVNHDWVVTSAYCLSTRPKTNHVVHLGKGEPPATKQELSPATDIKVSSFVAHPEYKQGESLDYDVALIRLERPITFSEDVSPVCLPWGRKISTDLTTSTVQIATWITSDQSPYKLTDVYADVLTTEKCDQEYGSIVGNLQLSKGISKNILCLWNGQFRDRCLGNMGGPVVYQDTNNESRYTVGGLVMFGLHECFPTFATSLVNGNIIAWIKQTAFQSN
ncbi:clotting factor G beta subunit-like [Oratosquilla oratoria]|uniref:clotting factor G beta subunit-like n=1 Tax=Oratosquilla oratoria TaxID=337810 RepID=UPI003F77212C